MAVFTNIIKESKTLSGELKETAKSVGELRKEIFSLFAVLKAIKEIPEKLKDELKLLKTITRDLGKLIKKVPLPGYFKFIPKGLGSLMTGISRISRMLDQNLKFLSKVLKRLPDPVKLEFPFSVLEGSFNSLSRLVVKSNALMAILETQEKNLEDKKSALIPLFEDHLKGIKKLNGELEKNRVKIDTATKELKQKKKELKDKITIFEDLYPKFKKILSKFKPLFKMLEEFFETIKPKVKEFEKFIGKYVKKIGAEVEKILDEIDKFLLWLSSYFGFEDEYKEFKKKTKEFYEDVKEAFDAIDDLMTSLLKEIDEIEEIYKSIEEIQKELMASINAIRRVMDEQVEEVQRNIEEFTNQFEAIINDSRLSKHKKEGIELKDLKDLNEFRKEIISFQRYFKLMKVRLKRLFEESDAIKKKKLKSLKKQSSSKMSRFILETYAILKNDKLDSEFIETAFLPTYSLKQNKIGLEALRVAESFKTVYESETPEAAYECLERPLEELKGFIESFESHYNLVEEELKPSNIKNLDEYFDEFESLLKLSPKKIEEYKPKMYVKAGLKISGMEGALKLQKYSFGEFLNYKFLLKFKKVSKEKLSTTGSQLKAVGNSTKSLVRVENNLF